MATTIREYETSPEGMWALLADAERYADWVVGAESIRRVEGDWPTVGARFHHRVGVWPLHIRDNTVVIEADPIRRLVLDARIRPLGVARIELRLEPAGTGTMLVMTETPTAPCFARWATPLIDPFMGWRNREALRRLAGLAGEPSA